MSADLKQLENQLSSLGVSALADYLGKEKSEKLSDLGIEITAANLAKLLPMSQALRSSRTPFSAGVSGNANERCAN